MGFYFYAWMWSCSYSYGAPLGNRSSAINWTFPNWQVKYWSIHWYTGWILLLFCSVCSFVCSKTTNQHLTWSSNFPHTVLFLSRFLSKGIHLRFPKRKKTMESNFLSQMDIKLNHSSNIFAHTRLVKQVTWLNIPQLNTGECQQYFPIFKTACVAKHIARIINPHALILAQKYMWQTFVLDTICSSKPVQFLSFILDNCLLLGTDNVHRQIFEHIDYVI